MLEYHKIETLFERDMDGTKKLIEGKFRNKMIEYIKDCEWTFTEKVDGTNIRVHWDGHKVEFNGRTDNANIHGHLVERLNKLFITNEAEEMFEQLFGEKEVYLFGEGYGAGIQTGGGYRDDKDFILFDVMVNGYFLDRKGIESIAKSFGIDVVPLIPNIKTLSEAVSFVKERNKTLIGKGEQEMEGVIGKPLVEMKDNYGNRIIVKIKSVDF